MKQSHLLLLMITTFLVGVNTVTTWANENTEKSAETVYYPSFETIATHFFDNYYVEQNLNQINFAKKPEGWSVQVKDELGEVENEYLIWSSKAQQYIDADLPTAEDDTQKSTFLKEYAWSKYNYERCPYYGYNGWNRDVIRHFGKQTEMQDTLLEGLARAYSHFAESFVRDQSGYQTNEARKKEYGYEPMDKDDFRELIRCTVMALMSYQRLAKQNPDYETIVGNVHVKMANCKMNTHLVLHSVQAYKEANAFISSNMYPPYLSDFAKNTLQSCAPNAILFTYGDNDTYPLWQVQKKEQFRTDVTVINLGLLATDWYNAMLRYDQFYPTKVQSILEMEQILGKNRNVNLLKKCEANANSMDLQAWLKHLGNDSQSIEKNGVWQGQYTTQKLTWEVDSKAVAQQQFLSEEQVKNLPKEISWELSAPYMLKGQVMLLDILAANNWQRPVYFSQSIPTDAFLGLDKFTQMEGLAHRLTPLAQAASEKATCTIASDLMSENLMEKFIINREQPYKDVSTFTYLGNNYRMAYACLAQDYVAQNDPARAKAVLDKCNQLLPNNFVSYTHQNVGFISTYYNANAPADAARLAKQVLDGTNEKIARLAKTDVAEAERLKGLTLAFIDEIAPYASQNEQKELLKLFKSYKKSLK